MTTKKAQTEQSLVNGVAILRKSLIEYNNLLNVSKDIKESFFDLYFKLKLKYPPGLMPVKDTHIRKFRAIEEMGKKSLYEEMSEISGDCNFQLGTAAAPGL